MTQFVSWILFPLVLALLALGCGLLLERASGLQLSEGLLMPTGLAVIIVAAEITTKSSATATLTTPLVVLLALIGLALSRPWRRRLHLARWPLVVAAAVYLAYLAPVLVSGEPTFAGYIKLDDTATWMAMTDRVLGFGHSLSGLAPSTYETTLYFDLAGTEPVGSMLPWGIGHQLVAEDLAWVFQPYLAFLGAALCLVAWSIAPPFLRSRGLRAIVVFVAAQAALIYGYSLWGGIKEMAAAYLLALAAACVIPVLEAGARVRAFLPLTAASFAMLGVLGYGGAVWLAVPLAAAGVGALRIWLRRSTRAQLAGWLALTAAVVVALVRGAQGFLKANGSLTSGALGNLIHPVDPLQTFGIWPAGDFRVSPPDAPGATYALVVLVIAAAAAGLLVAWRRRAWALPLYLAAAGVGVGLVSAKGGPWVQAKAFATASPAPLLAAALALGVLLEAPPGLFAWEPRRRGLVVTRRVLAGGSAAAIALGVLWSNVLAYHHVTLAPYGQLSELEQIGQGFAGQGPTTINEFEPYAARHFLRAMDPESPSELRRRVIPLRTGGIVPTGGYADLDAFQLPGLLVYRTIITRTSPVASRPPAPYQLVDRGRWYEVWRRPRTLARPLIDSIPLGDELDPSAVPVCSQVRALAREAGAHGLLAASSRAAPIVMPVPRTLRIGSTVRRFAVSRPGVYEVWLGGSFVRRLTASVDGARLGSSSEVLNEAGGWTPLGTIHLAAGPHTITLSYGGSELAPGAGGAGGAGPFFSAGPLAVSPVTTSFPVTYVKPADARLLCGRSWDWIDALGP
jgi:hypothetical protein